MTDMPSIDAAEKAFVHAFTERAGVKAALRIANPWTPTAEEIEAMAHGMDQTAIYHSSMLGKYSSYFSKGDWASLARAAYRARPIMRELYDSDGVPR